MGYFTFFCQKCNQKIFSHYSFLLLFLTTLSYYSFLLLFLTTLSHYSFSLLFLITLSHYPFSLLFLTALLTTLSHYLFTFFIAKKVTKSLVPQKTRFSICSFVLF